MSGDVDLLLLVRGGGRSGRFGGMDASPNLEKKVIVSHCEAVQIFSTTVAQVGRDDEGLANVVAPLSLSVPLPWRDGEMRDIDYVQ